MYLIDEKNEKKYGLYIRKSSEDTSKQIASIENQSQVLKEKAIKEGLKIVNIYSESKSAKKPGKRKEFSQLIEDLRTGVIDAVITWSLCRLSRNPTEGGMIQQSLLDGVIKEIVTFDRRYYPSDNSVVMAVELGIATDFSQRLSKFVKRGHKFKVYRGSYPNKAPIGYSNTMDRNKGEKEIIPDPERFDMVRSLWDMLLTGDYSVLEILDKAKAIGLKHRPTRNSPARNLTKNCLYKMFRNPLYYGEFRWSGEAVKGNHIPMVTKKEFAEVGRIILKRDRPKQYKHNFSFKGLIKCGECGASVIAEHKDKVRKDGSINYRTYYRCTHRKANVKCKQKAMREEKLDEEFTRLLDSISIPDTFVQWARRFLDSQYQESSTRYELIKENQRKQIDRIDKQLNKLIDLKLEDVIDDETFKFKKELLTEEKRAIEKEMMLNSDSKSLDIDKTIKTLEFCRDAKELFEQGDEDDNKIVLQGLCSLFYIFDSKLSIELAFPYKVAQDGKKLGITTNPRFATLETRTRTGLDKESCQLIKLGGGEGELPSLSKKEIF